MSIGFRVRARLRTLARPLVRRAASLVGLEAYEPDEEHRRLLAERTEYLDDPRPVRDKRASTAHADIPDLTLTVEGLEDVLGWDRFVGARILEVGPKYGVHSLWLDEHLAPSELVFCDFASDMPLHEEWRHRLVHPHRFVYGDLKDASELVALGPFDLVLFLGVLYHSVSHLPMLSVLNRATRLGGCMLLETTFDPRADASVRLRWQNKSGKAKAVPTITATRLMLAWTGWRRVHRFGDYRPGSKEAMFLCEKTDELEDGSDFAWTVTPQRSAAPLGAAV